MINKRNVLTLVLALALTIGSLNVIMAESVSSVGEFVPYFDCTAYFDANCSDTYGEASTHLYVDNRVTSAYAEVSMTMYVIDSYYLRHITDPEIWDELCEYYASDSDSSSELCDSRVLTDAEVTGTSYKVGERQFVGYKVKSDHYASITTSSGTYSCSDSLNTKEP